MSGIEGCTVQAFRGDSISKLTNRIKTKEADLSKFDFVILHVGTNDIANKASFEHIISDYGNLIGVCRNVKPSLKIVVSAIIPRPVDHEITDGIIRQVNTHLNNVMSKDMNFRFICTYKPFTHCGKVKRELFAKRDGGLHLNFEGTNRLKYFFLKVITHL